MAEPRSAVYPLNLLSSRFYADDVDDDDNDDDDGYDDGDDDDGDDEDDNDDDDCEDDADDAGDSGMGQLLIYGLPSESLCCKKGDSPYLYKDI